MTIGSSVCVVIVMSVLCADLLTGLLIGNETSLGTGVRVEVDITEENDEVFQF